MSGGTVPGESAVAIGIADFLARTEIERLRLFRRYTAATLRRVSPLLVQLFLMEGVSLRAAMASISPPGDWPWRPIPDDRPGLRRRAIAAASPRGSVKSSEASRFRRAFAAPGVVVREFAHPRGPFGVRPSRGVLGFAAGIGPCVLSSCGTTAALKLPEALPETLVLALPGRRLGDIVDHPLFRDEAYRVTRVWTDPSDGLPVLCFRVSLVPLEVGLADGRT